jgi:hypothetical protein
MSDKPQLPGYSVDDDTQDDNDDAHHIDVATAEPERPVDMALSASSASADDAVTVASTATVAVSSPTPQESTQYRSTPPNEQEAGEERPTADITTVAATPTTPPLPVDEFADPKISGLHTIFPDYDAVIL